MSGERTIYFEDDNKLDLKTLVQQEKSGTAEDQNTMFARLAGRSGDRDLDVDDMFVTKAAHKQDENRAANRDRSAAIFEHRKINAAMEKCPRCFDKVPKHLIVAIGTKSYLCVPAHRSLVDGHCLIVPMQHISSCTAVDEDVWREMQ
ncbi:CWF19-like protein 2, partial [Elysia marginata]